MTPDRAVAEHYQREATHTHTPDQTHCTTHGHAYPTQCLAAQGLGCRNTCGWKARY